MSACDIRLPTAVVIVAHRVYEIHVASDSLARIRPVDVSGEEEGGREINGGG